MNNIVVTGANGRLGSAVVKALLRVAPDQLLGVSVRDPDAARGLLGVEVRHGDFNQAETLPMAFEGAERLLIISTSDGNETRIRQHRNAIEAARRAGVQHIYYTSIVQRAGSPFWPTEGHLQTEADLIESGLSYTIFRNGQYMENLPMFLGDSLQTGVLALPPDGPVAWVALADLAEGIARVISSKEFGNQTLLLTGPRSIDFDEVAQIAGDIVDKRVERRVVSNEEYKERLVARGLSEGFADVLTSGFESRARGELAIVDPQLARLLGRARRTLEDVLPQLLARTPAARRQRTEEHAFR